MTNLPIRTSDLRENLQMRQIIEDQMDRLNIPKNQVDQDDEKEGTIQDEIKTN